MIDKGGPDEGPEAWDSGANIDGVGGKACASPG